MTPQTFIFVGQSGSGKGEQSTRLQKVLKEKFGEDEVIYMETGPNFREFIKGEKYSNKLCKAVADAGTLQPAFLPIYFWVDWMINNLNGSVQHIVFDGICRRLEEAVVFTTAMEFYNRKPTIIYVKVSNAWAKDKLMGRGRVDDKNEEQVNGRLAWFDRDVLPVIEYFRENDRYTLLEINGEQTIEEVHREILEKLGW
jgi:adenylate kinase family enzyme